MKRREKKNAKKLLNVNNISLYSIFRRNKKNSILFITNRYRHWVVIMENLKKAAAEASSFLTRAKQVNYCLQFEWKWIFFF